MFTNFDCSVYYVKDKEALINTFSIQPEYLKTKSAGKVNDYRDWGIQLGRRFRALKLWFVIRNFGVTGIKEKIRDHITYATELENLINQSKVFEMITPRTLNLVCFRYIPDSNLDDETLNKLNENLLQELNETGKLFLTHTKLHGKYTLRLVIGQTNVTRNHVLNAWELIKSIAKVS
jgi:aromatic-L-amino-acid decarboxylase